MKDLPYFPMYAANIMSSRSYKIMNLTERGLWITVSLECWVNGGVPSSFKDMSKILGFPEEELRQYFSKYQTTFFHIENGQYVSRELEEYRKGYEEKREKQRLGGIKGAKEKLAKQKATLDEVQGLHEGVPIGQPKGSLSYFNSDSIKLGSMNSNQLTKKELTDDAFDKWMDGADDAPDISNAYLKASRG